MAFSKEEAILDNKIAINTSAISALDSRLTVAESTLADLDSHAIRDDVAGQSVLSTFTVQGSTPQLILTDTDSSGTAATPYISFYDSAASRRGYIGPASGSNSYLYVNSEVSKVLLTYANATKLTTESYGIDVTGSVRMSDGLYQDGQAILNGTDTWLRTYGGTGWYNGTYDGGWYMADVNYVRVYNAKRIYTNSTATDAISCDGGVQINGSLSRFGGSGANVGILYLDTQYGASPQIGFADGTSGISSTWSVGYDDVDTNFKIHGVSGGTFPVINNLADPHFEISRNDGYITTKIKTIWTGNTTSGITVSSYVPTDIDAADLLVEWSGSSGTAAGDTNNLLGTMTWVRGRNSRNTAYSGPSASNNDTRIESDTSNLLRVYYASSSTSTSQYVKSITLLQAYKY